MPPSRRYRQPHFQDTAAILAAEREANGPSPALNRITAAFTALYTQDSRSAGSRPPYIFDPVLFRQVALGQKDVSARPRRDRGDRGRKTEISPAEAGRESGRRFQRQVTEAARRVIQPAPAPAAPVPGGITASQAITRALSELAGMDCMFFACPGPDKPFVSMATCRRCAAIQDFRAMQNRVHGTTRQETRS